MRIFKWSLPYTIVDMLTNLDPIRMGTISYLNGLRYILRNVGRLAYSLRRRCSRKELRAKLDMLLRYNFKVITVTSG
jgi:hypothetical protein